MTNYWNQILVSTPPPPPPQLDRGEMKRKGNDAGHPADVRRWSPIKPGREVTVDRRNQVGMYGEIDNRETARGAVGYSLVTLSSCRQTLAGDAPPRPSGRDNAAYLAMTAQPACLGAARRAAPPLPLSKRDHANGPVQGGHRG